ncbi:Transposase for insertion sequence element IST2, partial [Bienertia sinuspersici]
MRPAKTIEKKKGTFKAKKKGVRKSLSRVKKPVQFGKEGDDGDDSDGGSDDSDASDYDLTESESEEDEEGIWEGLFDEFEGMNVTERNECDDDEDEPDHDQAVDQVGLNRLYRNGKIVGDMPFRQIKLATWMIFNNKDHFLTVFRDYAIQEGFAVRVEKHDNLRFTAVCLIEGCDWRIHASQLMDRVSWAVKTMSGEHTLCGRLENNPMVNSEWLLRHLQDDITTTPNISIDSLQKLCLEKYWVKVGKRLLYKVRMLAKSDMHGGYAESYGLLPAYAKMIKQTNPSTYAIVDKESIDSWLYFFRNLKTVFRIHGVQRDDYTFISDRMRGVEAALYEVFPKATRRICCQHLQANFANAGFSGGAYTKLFWTAADAYNEFVFNKAMEKLGKLNPEAHAYLQNVTELWSRHKYEASVCCDHNTTNFVESLNSITKEHRDLPVLALLETVREWCMKRIGERYDFAVDMDPNTLTTGGGEFEVRERHVVFPIKLADKQCMCGVWQISGIPCKHGLRVIYDQ